MPYPPLEAYRIEDADSLLTPALVIFRPLLEHNLDEMIRLAGGPERLRPHCKTHKCPQIVREMLQRGITRHKCATLAEAEMLATCGAAHVLIAYPLVGPHLPVLVHLLNRFPETRFAVLVDHPQGLEGLAEAVSDANAPLEVLVDLNPGMHRTGIAPGPRAIELYESIAACPGLEFGGLHWYDGHHRQADRSERQAAVLAGWETLVRFRDLLLLSGLPIPRIVAAGTGSFPILAELGEPQLELSPGTTTLMDDDLVRRFPELDLLPAQGILTRVISANRAGELTLDLGHKACAADPPAGQRLFFPELPDAREVLHSEEHLVIETSAASRFQLGDTLLGISRHACPVSLLYPAALIVDEGRVVGRWPLAARDRWPLELPSHGIGA